MDDISAALRELHRASLVYGDIRRSNIMVDNSSGVWRGKLIDFDQSGRDASGNSAAMDDDGDEAGGTLYDCFLANEPGWPVGVKA